MSRCYYPVSGSNCWSGIFNHKSTPSTDIAARSLSTKLKLGKGMDDGKLQLTAGTRFECRWHQVWERYPFASHFSHASAGIVLYVGSESFTKGTRVIISATRLIDRPIIGPELHASIGVNIQGPSLIRRPIGYQTASVPTTCILRTIRGNTFASPTRTL
jgi:hypothetical protein